MDESTNAEVDAAPDASKLWQRLVPWLLLAATIALLVWPLMRVWPLIGGAITGRLSAGAGQPSDYVELGASTHFRVVGPAGYMNEGEITRYLSEAEVRRARLVEFLEVPGDARQVRILVHQQWGIPHVDPPASITLYGLKAGRNALIHELTHLLVHCRSSFLSEGLAVLAEEQFGWGLAFPNWLRPVDSHLYAWRRGGNEMLSLEDLAVMGGLWDPNASELSRLRYLHAGSFANYVVAEYGLDAFAEVCMHSDFKRAWGRPLRELEAEWLVTVQRGHMVQGLVVTIGGLAILGLMHLAMSKGWPWILAAVVGTAAFSVWSVYLVYPYTVWGGLVAAIAAGAIVRRWLPGWGLLTMWVLGSAVLAALVLWPAVVWRPT